MVIYTFLTSNVQHCDHLTTPEAAADLGKMELKGGKKEGTKVR
jgi:hypothetical protein